MKKQAIDVEPEDMIVDGQVVDGVKVRWLFSKKDGTRDVTLREFTLKNTITPVHNHPWEHIIYVLKGHGSIKIDDKWLLASEGDVFFIPENMHHMYTCKRFFVFLCAIPNTGNRRGW